MVMPYLVTFDVFGFIYECRRQLQLGITVAVLENLAWISMGPIYTTRVWSRTHQIRESYLWTAHLHLNSEVMLPYVMYCIMGKRCLSVPNLLPIQQCHLLGTSCIEFHSLI